MENTRGYARAEDPLRHAPISVQHIPEFKSGREVMMQLEKMVLRGENVSAINGNKEIINFAQGVFHDTTSSNNIGNNVPEDFKYWDNESNIVTIELDKNNVPDDKAEQYDVYVGGPSALFSAAIQSFSPDSHNVIYISDGCRNVSNWKGSASILHPIDSVPTYYWSKYNPWKIIIETFKQNFMKWWNCESYIHHVKANTGIHHARLNPTNILKHPHVLKVMLLNQIYAVKDTGFPCLWKPMSLVKREQTAAHMIVNHSFLSYEILSRMNLLQNIIMTHDKVMNVIYFSSLEGNQNLDDENYVESLVDEPIATSSLTSIELQTRGYYGLEDFSAAVQPNDAYFLPTSDIMLEKMIEEGRGKVVAGYRLSKVLCEQTPNGCDVRARRVIVENTKTGDSMAIPINTLYLSLGPSMRKLLVNTTSKTVNILEEIMWAAASSSVLIIKVDPDKVSSDKLGKFRDTLVFNATTCVRLAEREVKVAGKKYIFFLHQVTGGGHFPCHYVHPEVPMNIISAIYSKILSLNDEGVEFDIISTRSCARGIVANNSFKLTIPLANMVMTYGLGGIGMTTMPSNALLMKAALGERLLLSQGRLTAQKLQNNFKDSVFECIPHWKHGNIFRRDYSRVLDSSYTYVPDVLLERQSQDEYVRMLHIE